MTMTHTAAFEHFGTHPTNVQWSWSAKSDQSSHPHATKDGKIVVVTLWSDQFSNREYKWSEYLPSKPGYRELMKNLSWAQAHCEGRFSVIMATPKPAKNRVAPLPRERRSFSQRAIQDCAPSRLVIKLKHLDTEKGEFIAVPV